MKSLTETERRFMKALTHKTPDRRIPLRELRLWMRLIAYHEAGHVVARMFTGLELSHMVRVSIIPDEGNLGRATTERCTKEAMLNSYPSEAQKQSTGRQLLITLLAGRGAIAHLCGQNSREYILHSNPEEWDIEGSDLFRADRVASIMAGKSRSHWPILQEAQMWTTELMDIPAAWQCVKRLAGRLIKDGSIEGDAIMDICDEVLLLALSMPKWKRRLYPGKGKAYIK
jgi:hypothetical protein